MKRLTMSRLWLAEECAASMALPWVEDATPSEPRDHGVVVHRYLQVAGEQGPAAALLDAPAERRDELLSLDLESLPVKHRESWAYEVAYAYRASTDTARELHRGGQRDYTSVADDEFAGTLDAVAVDAERGEVVYLDTKTGRGELENPEDAPQLLAGALAAARATGMPAARVGWLHLPKGGLPRYRWARLSMLDLDTRVRERIERDVEAVRRAQATPVEQLEPRVGAWCGRCPAWSRCPAQVALARQVTAAALGTLETPIEVPAEKRPEFVHWVHAIEVLSKRLSTHLEDMARREPIAMPDGKVYGPVTIEREYLDGLVTERVLATNWPELVDKAVEHVHSVKASKASITEAVKAWRPPGRTQTSFVKEVLAAIRAQGGAFLQAHEEVKAHRPPKPKELEAPAAEAEAPSTEEQQETAA